MENSSSFVVVVVVIVISAFIFAAKHSFAVTIFMKMGSNSMCKSQSFHAYVRFDMFVYVYICCILDRAFDMASLCLFNVYFNTRTFSNKILLTKLIYEINSFGLKAN